MINDQSIGTRDTISKSAAYYYYWIPCSFENPKSCQVACNHTLTMALTPASGFASEYLHIIAAHMYAILKNRRFIINSTFWNYGDYFEIFDEPQIIEKTCVPIKFHEMDVFKEIVVEGDHNASHLLFSRSEITLLGKIFYAYSAGFSNLRGHFIGGTLKNYTALNLVRKIVSADWQLTVRMQRRVAESMKGATNGFRIDKTFIGLQTTIVLNQTTNSVIFRRARSTR